MSITRWRFARLNKTLTCQRARRVPRLPIGKEVSNFVRAYESLHALLAREDTLTSADQDLIEFSATELLSRVRPV
jgi:hypothetical protein